MDPSLVVYPVYVSLGKILNPNLFTVQLILIFDLPAGGQLKGEFTYSGLSSISTNTQLLANVCMLGVKESLQAKFGKSPFSVFILFIFSFIQTIE